MTDQAALTLAFAGDVMLGRLVNAAVAERGFAFPWGNVLPVLGSADLFLINLECALTSERAPWHDGQYKAFYFKADPSVVETLRIGGVDFASLANNHIRDFRTAGLLETVTTLDRAGIAHAGAGKNLTAARSIARLSAKGLRVAVVAFADYPPEWAAGPDVAGINYTNISLAAEELAVVQAAIEEAREQADVVIFSIHWGPNMRSHPEELFRQFARSVVASGADIFWGHSAHVVQGVELWEGKPIMYDTGDLIDDYAVDEGLRNDLSALFLVHVRPPCIEGVEVVPVHIDDMQVNLAEGDDRRWFGQRFASLCREMGTETAIHGSRVSLVLPPSRVEMLGREPAS